MRVEVLATSWQRAWGATWARSLQGRMLVFVYPRPIRHLFHTFFCPPLRITTLDPQGRPAYSVVPKRHRLVPLPATRIVLETAPEVSPEDAAMIFRARFPTGDPRPSGWLAATLDQSELLHVAVGDATRQMRALLFRLLHARRRDRAGDGPALLAALLAALPVWEQGRILADAASICEFGDLPELEVPAWSKQLAQLVLTYRPAGDPDEFEAAGIAGGPWPEEFQGVRCLKCGKRGGAWRPVLGPDWRVPPEACWRYERPENHIPLCRTCVRDLHWPTAPASSPVTLWGRPLVAALGLWGARFRALLAWDGAVKHQLLPPEWNRHTHPLWPPEYGGETWETGSGAALHADMRLPEKIPLHTALVRAGLRRIPGPARARSN